MSAPILFLDHAPGLGGAERSLLLLLEHLDRDRWEPHLAGAPGPVLEHARTLGVRVHALLLPRLRRSLRFPLDGLSGARRLARTAGAIGAASLYANTVRAAIYGAASARIARLPFLWHMRDFWLSEREPASHRLDRLGKRVLCAAAHTVIANSHAVADALPCPDRVTVVHNGLDMTRFDPDVDPTPFRQRYGIPLEAPLIGVVGRLRPWKGQHRFLRSMAEVAATHPEARFALIGGTPLTGSDDYPKELGRLAQALGLADRVTFTGQLEDVRPALAALDAFVHAGDPEPFGLAILEAMAMAKPVVAFAHGGLPEIIEHGHTGLLVPPGDADELSDAVLVLLNDRRQRIAFGAAGRKRALERFSIQTTAAAVDGILAAAISNRGGETRA